jgi:hypothetical protein
MPIKITRKKGPNSPSKDPAGKVEGALPATAKGAIGHAPPAPKKSEDSPSVSDATAGYSKIRELTEEESQLRARLRSKLNRQEAAAYLSDLGYPMTKNRLSKFVGEGGGPEYTKFGRQAYYFPDALLSWAKARERVVTGKDGAGHPKT